MDAQRAREIAGAYLAASPPGVDDAVLLEQVDDHDWCYVIQWTVREGVPQPGVGPVAVDKASGEAFYLGSQPLPIALDMARSMRQG